MSTSKPSPSPSSYPAAAPTTFLPLANARALVFSALTRIPPLATATASIIAPSSPLTTVPVSAPDRRPAPTQTSNASLRYLPSPSVSRSRSHRRSPSSNLIPLSPRPSSVCGPSNTHSNGNSCYSTHSPSQSPSSPYFSSNSSIDPRPYEPYPPTSTTTTLPCRGRPGLPVGRPWVSAHEMPMRCPLDAHEMTVGYPSDGIPMDCSWTTPGPPVG